MPMLQAQDTFSAEHPDDGTPMGVTKGDIFHDSHWVVKLDQGRGLLFKPLAADDEKPKRTRATAGAADGGES